MTGADTIVALSSGALPAGVAVIRLSGPATEDVIKALAGALPEPRRLSLRTLRSADTVFDQGLVAWFPGPHSFTGEDCAELQVHGSRAVVRALLRQLTGFPSVRLAVAGEFTRRAFEHGRLDLTEIEGLGDLIEAETENQRRQALGRLSGGLTQQLQAWRERLLDLRAEIEARLDFSDEGDVAEGLGPNFERELIQLRQEFEQAAGTVARGRIIREGFRVALAGRPNVGKSSLLNALAASDVAIVSDEPGTTRDVKEVALDLGGQKVILLDLAGLRESESKAEAEGVRRAHREIAGADLVLSLYTAELPEVRLESAGDIWPIRSKVDLEPWVAADGISSATGEGVPQLLARIGERAAAAAGTGEPVLVSRERDRLALLEAAEAVSRAGERLAELELGAEALRQASHSLERLLGRMDAESVLDRLFLSFCIGK